MDSRAELLPAERDGQRWVALEITVTNTRSFAILVADTVHGGAPRTYAFDVRGPQGGLSTGEIATDSSTLFFGPFETKRWLYEFRVGSELTRHQIPAGQHRIRGGYARIWANWDTVAAGAALTQLNHDFVVVRYRP